MVNCPYCHKSITLCKSDVHTYDMAPRPLFGRRRLEQTAAPAQPWTPVREAQPPRQLGAGEEVHRPFSWRDDIEGPLVFAVVYGAFVLIGAAGVQYRLPVVVVVDVVVCAVFTRLRWDTWKTGDTNPIVGKREAENKPHAGGTWRAESVVKAGNTTTIDRPTLTNPQRWHEFCKAVVNGKHFSQSQSRKNKVPPSDWDSIYESWTGRGWLVPQGGRKAPHVRAQAMAHIRNYGRNPPTPPTDEA